MSPPSGPVAPPSPGSVVPPPEPSVTSGTAASMASLIAATWAVDSLIAVAAALASPTLDLQLAGEPLDLGLVRLVLQLVGSLQASIVEFA